MRMKDFLAKCFKKTYYVMGDLIQKNEMKKRNLEFIPTKPRKMGEKVIIIGNGPSCKLFFENEEKFSDYDKIVVNFFPSQSKKEFMRIKPKYICLADNKLFEDENRGKQIVQILEKVNWKMYIIQPALFELNIANKNIHFIKISSYEYICAGKKKYQNQLYLNNLAIPACNNVINWAVFFSIVFGYKKVGLIGVENSMFQDISIGMDNKIYLMDKHYYGTKKVDYSKEGIYKKGTFYLYMESHYRNFLTHKILSDLAIENNVDIVNYTIDSFIDVYRKKDLTKE